MFQTACLIFNPISGQGDPELELQTISDCLTPHLQLNIMMTTPDLGAKQLAQKALEQSVDVVIASGGDGTISAVASALIHQSVPLGVIARGTANAFANALNIPVDLEQACHAITHGSTQVIDSVQRGSDHMILLAGIGLEAEAIRRADRDAKDRLGALAYIFAGLDQIRALDLFDAQLEIDRDRIIAVSAAAITIANAAPATSVLAHGPAGVIPDDGLLDITIVAPSSTLDAMAASIHLFRSALNDTAATQQSIGYLRAKHVKVTTSPEQRVIVDGELCGNTPIELECLPQSLRVCTPIAEDSNLPQQAEKLDSLPNLEVSQLSSK